MDPVTLTLGAVVSALVSRAAGKVGEQTADAGWAVLGRLAGRVRRHFREHGDDTDRAALTRVEDPPASPKHLEALAIAIDRHARADPTLRKELQGLVDEAAKTDVDVTSIVQSAWGDHNVQIAGVTGSTVSINSRRH